MLTKGMVADIPHSPGVYFFRDRRAELLYIGKARSLRKRVRQYAASREQLTPKVRKVVARTHSVDYRVLGSELEALIAESRLIKEMQPRYNVARKSVRHHPFLKIQRQERFPRVVVAWEIEDDGSEYFGPLPNRVIGDETRGLLHQLFPLRTCELAISPDPDYRPCFSYDIGRCDAPCAAAVTDARYDAVLDRVCDFLRGSHGPRRAELLAERAHACERLEFERARLIQSRIGALDRYAARTQFQINALHYNHLVVVCPSVEDGRAELFFIRSSRLRRQERVTRLLPARELGPVFDEVFGRAEDASVPTTLDVDAMNVTSQWLYANRHRQEIVRLDDLGSHSRAEAVTRVHEVLLSGYLSHARREVAAHAV